MTTFLLIVIAAISYFFGGFNGAIISSKYIFKKDVRNYGSGNAGLTNFYRTFGVAGIALVLAVDILKSVLAVLSGSLLLGIVGEPMVGKVFAGFCLMLGHSYPVMYALRGGKGVLCAAVVALMADWRVGILCLAVFAIVVVVTRYVSLGSLIGSALLPLGIWVLRDGALAGLIALFVFLLIAFTHRANIGRLLAGKENMIEFGAKTKRSRT